MINRYHKLKASRSFQESIEPHEVFLDKLAQDKEREIPESDGKIERPLAEKKIWLLWCGVVFIFLVLLGRISWFQLVGGQEYLHRAANNRFIASAIRAERGVIYDRFMNQLVRNQTVYRLIIDPNGLPSDPVQREWWQKRLSDFTEIPDAELNEKLHSKNESRIILQADLTYDQIIIWETKSEDWPGVVVEKDLIRHYVEEGGLSHVLGYVSRADQIGAAGIEQYYDNYLKDRPGSRQIERDARGRILADKIVEEPQPGYSLVLNIDHELQVIMERVLREKMIEVGASEANAVALDPRNGAVRALVSMPGYDNNIFGHFLSAEEMSEMTARPDFSLFNQAISGIGYATGSIIKPIISVAALEEKVIDPDQKIYAPQKICATHRYTGEQQCFRDWRFHGMTDLRRAIAESVNTYFYIIGGGYQNIQGLGPNKLRNWLERFNWGELTGIDLPNEGQGILPKIDENWRLGNTYHLSIGQGIFSVTPVQVATAYAAIANGGVVYQPQVVDRIIHQNGGQKELIQEIQPKTTNSSVASLESIQVVREGMRQAVTSPQSPTHSLNNLKVTTALKTGTAQTDRDRVYHNWIALFAPYEEPEIVMVFMIRDVYGSMIAVRSVAQEVLGLYFDHKDDKFQ